MIRGFASQLRSQWAGFLALFLVLTGGVAYAANTVFSTDIVDGQVKTADLANGAASSAKLADGSVTSDKVKDDSIQGRDVKDNNLKGVDIDESTLSNIGGGGPAGGDLTGDYPDPSLAPGAVTTTKFKTRFYNNNIFPPINGSSCASTTVPFSDAPIIGAGDVILVTPPRGWPDTFTIVASPGTNDVGIKVAACNTFPSGSVDPDGNISNPVGSYRFIVIEQ